MEHDTSQLLVLAARHVDSGSSPLFAPFDRPSVSHRVPFAGETDYTPPPAELDANAGNCVQNHEKQCRIQSMPSRLVLAVAFAAAAGRPSTAQTIVSNHPPLAPDEAVRVLRSSHSLSDMANRPILDPDGPRVYVIGHDASDDVLPPLPPPEPLSRDRIMPVPYGGYFDGGYPWGGYGVIRTGPRHHSREHTRSTTVASPPTPAPPPPPRNLVMGVAPSAGVAARRR